MLADDHLVMLGYDARDADSFDAAALAAHPGVLHLPDERLRESPEGAARQAVDALLGGTESVIVHFDVDAVDSGDLPLGNFPHYATGVTLETAATVLRVLCSVPRLAAVVLTEVNPAHDPSGHQLDRYIEAVVGALAH